MTFPLIDTMLYGLYCSTIEIAIVGSLSMCRFFADVSDVFIKIFLSSSISDHTGVMCGDPSSDKVDTKVRFRPLNNFEMTSIDKIFDSVEVLRPFSVPVAKSFT